MLIFVEGGKPENAEKNPQGKARTNNKLNPHMTPGPGFEPGPYWWETSALTTAPILLFKYKNPLTKIKFEIQTRHIHLKISQPFLFSVTDKTIRKGHE